MARDLGFSVFSLNSRGLRSQWKRKGLFKYLKEKSFDVICLQETHITEKVYKQWKKEWGNGEFIYNAFKSNSCGQIILFKERSIDNHKLLHNSKRIIAAEVELSQGKMAVVNVYAPNNDSEKQAFLDDLAEVISSIQSEHILVCGDFNCVLSNDLDIISGEKHSENTVNKFNELIGNLDLYDTWRLFNPQDKEFTWFRNNPFIARRLDYVLTNANLFDKTIDCNIHSVPSTDHRGCSILIKFSNIERGPGLWKFNNSLLNDPKYVSEMNSLIQDFTSEIVEHTDYQMEWELLKLKIKSHTISYSKMKNIE